MAFTFNDEDVLKMEVSDGITISDKNSQSIESPLKAKDMTNEPMLTDSAEKDIFNSTDSLSSSTSFSDSDLTSTDSEDSLALSESESITDVTPLNSPYCDSPLPPSRIFDSKNEDKNNKIATRECPPEMNVLKQAIEKLELEAKEFDKQEGKVVSFKRRTKSQGHEDSKRMEQETRLFKRVVSRQNHRRTMSPTTNSPVKAHIVNRSQDNVKSDSEIKTSFTSRTMDEVSSAIKKK